MAMTSKAKKPNKVVNPVSAEYYEQFNRKFVVILHKRGSMSAKVPYSPLFFINQ